MKTVSTRSTTVHRNRPSQARHTSALSVKEDDDYTALSVEVEHGHTSPDAEAEGAHTCHCFDSEEDAEGQLVLVGRSLANGNNYDRGSQACRQKDCSYCWELGECSPQATANATNSSSGITVEAEHRTVHDRLVPLRLRKQAQLQRSFSLSYYF